MKEIPAIAIFKMGSRYRVEIWGKPIERLKSFEVKISNSLNENSVTEWPAYRVEQYLPPVSQREERPTFKI